MSIPTLILPAWLRPHLLQANHPGQLASQDLLRLREGLATYSPEKPAASIVIPAFNEAEHIAKTLSSLASLQLPRTRPIELLVVDDASTDATPEWLEALGVRFIRLPSNLSAKEARKAGLEACRGEIVLQADADSVYPPGWGFRFLDLLAQPEVAMVYGGHAFLPDPRTSRVALAVHEGLGNVARQIRRRHREHINVHGFNSAFWRGQGLQYGSYDHDQWGSEDGQMALALGKVGKLVYCHQLSCRVWTSPRRLLAQGGLWKGSARRLARDWRRMKEYLTGKS